jgi:hypothetical protein
MSEEQMGRERMSGEQGSGDENSDKELLLPEYPQAGVASTCRSYREYMAMFALREADLRRGPVLDVAGGASSFTARLSAMGVEAFAADPFYDGEREAVVAAARREAEEASAKVEALKHIYDWSFYESPERHRLMREEACREFAEHFLSEEGGRRYVAASLPRLPFADGFFHTVVCSHFLFLYGDRFDEAFHLGAVAEMLRVTAPGGEVRVYPLVTLQWKMSPIVEAIIENARGCADGEQVSGSLPFIPVESPVLRLRKR